MPRNLICGNCKKTFIAYRASSKFCSRACSGHGRTYKTLEDHHKIFFKNFIKKSKSECWPWIGCKNKKGYGVFRMFARGIQAHRASWWIHKGEKVPDHLLACHTCDNPSCVNPDHIFIGTNKDNMRDMVEKGRKPRPLGELSHNSKLKEFEVLEIYKSHLPASAIHEKYGVSQSTIWAIRKGDCWTHLTDGVDRSHIELPDENGELPIDNILNAG